jgi:hypothetical protein
LSKGKSSRCRRWFPSNYVRKWRFEATCRERQDHGSQGGTVRTDRRETKISDRGNILIFDKGVGLDLRNEPPRRAQSQLIEAQRMSAIPRRTRWKLGQRPDFACQWRLRIRSTPRGSAHGRAGRCLTRLGFSRPFFSRCETGKDGFDVMESCNLQSCLESHPNSFESKMPEDSSS